MLLNIFVVSEYLKRKSGENKLRFLGCLRFSSYLARLSGW